MSDERELKDGWEEGTLLLHQQVDSTVCGPIRHVVLVKPACQSRKWLVVEKKTAPGSCFADAAPAPDGPLKAGERVYVDCPVGACRWETLDRHVGFGRIGVTEIGRGRDCVQVEMESPCAPLILPPAACHREGPKGEPPEEGAVFLGRHGDGDFWWHDGKVCRWRIGGWLNTTPDFIQREGPMLNFVGLWDWQAALAVAYELGLVPDAKPENVASQLDMIQQPEPERGCDTCRFRPGLSLAECNRCAPGYNSWQPIVPAKKPKRPEPEPKYKVGQMAENKDGFVGRIGCISGHRSSRGYGYQFCVGGGGFSWYEESDLAPHAMTLADVPDATLVAIMRRKKVRVVEHPVRSDGTPSDSHKSGQVYKPAAFWSESVTMGTKEGVVVYAWNLEPDKT